MDILTQQVEPVNGERVTKITLVNNNKVAVSVLTMGATWQEFLVPSVEGGQKNLIVGFDNPNDYYKNSLCVCQSIGRVAGRIGKGRFSIDGRTYQVPQNERGNCLHGGIKGFNAYHWEFETVRSDNQVSVILRQEIKEAVDAFPGDFKVAVTFTLDNTDTLSITYRGYHVTADTLFNPTNHVYFNLSDKQDLSTHRLRLRSSAYLETEADLIPTGQFLPVANTPYDFQQEKNLYEAVLANNGFDDAFVLEPSEDAVAILTDTASGDRVSIHSDRNGLVMYTMNAIAEGIYFAKDQGKEAKAFGAVAMEAQTLPDAVNHEGFGDIVLRKGQEATYTIRYHYEKID